MRNQPWHHIPFFLSVGNLCDFVFSGSIPIKNYVYSGYELFWKNKHFHEPENMIFCNKSVSKSCGQEAVCVAYPKNDSIYYCMCPQTSEPLQTGQKCSTRKAQEPKPVKFHHLTIEGKINPNSTEISGIQNVTTQPVLPHPSHSRTISESVTNPFITEKTIINQNITEIIRMQNATTQPVLHPSTSSRTIIAVPMSLQAIILLTFLFLIVLIISLVFIWKFVCYGFGLRRHKTDKNKALAIQLGKNILVEERYTTNPQYTSADGTAEMSVGLVPIISRNSITDLYEIGEGFFGKVYRGQLHTIDNGEENVEMVAVKMLKQTANLEAEEDFMREVEIMSSFHHPNILILIGVCPRENNSPPWMIFEFMPFGDLADVLRSSTHQSWKSVSALPTLNARALLSISSQIADGMEYLAAQRFVHRDLACRNCLVGSGLTVKISDFGMSRDVYTCEYYKIGGSRTLPIRWMSPESISYGKFTLESDIWSYGVVLWEIYSYGKQPYYGHTNEEALKFILGGILLDFPSNCPEEIADIMKLCWKKEPKERIRFLDICNRLSKMKECVSNLAVPSLPRPPLLTVTIDYPVLFEDEPDETLDEENYLRPKSPPSESFLNGYLVTIP